MSALSTASSSPPATSPDGEYPTTIWNEDDGLSAGHDANPVHISSSPETDVQMRRAETERRSSSDITGDSKMMTGSYGIPLGNGRGSEESDPTHRYISTGSANQEEASSAQRDSALGQRALPSHPARDRKRRLISTGSHDRLQRARSGDFARISTQSLLPHRSVSMIVPNRGKPHLNGPGSSYATAIDITSSPPDAGPSVSRRSEDFRPRAGSTASRESGQGPSDTRMLLQPGSGYGMHPPSSSLSAARALERHHSSSLRVGALDQYPQYIQSGRPRGQSEAIRNPRRERQSGVGWQVSGTDESTLRAFLSGSTEAQSMLEALGASQDEVEMENTLPRWQPDGEVSTCPICETAFNFWYRKHHCRKCGRVVCASCSPHRITIPRQFIVRPPESLHLHEHSPPPLRQIVDLTEDNPVELPSSLNPALGGGEEVRLCNPCVPDPNPNPLGFGRTRGHRPSHSLPSGMGQNFSRDRAERRRNRQDSQPSSPEFPRAVGDNRRRSLRNESASRQSPLDSTDSHQRLSTCEQDLCPICGRRFPAISNDRPLEEREAHTRQCIENYGAPAAAQPASSARRGPEPRSLPPPPSASRMIEFTATEKDCIGEDGGPAECTICMVDYEGGDLLVRLECLCKFHKHCILDWFVHKMECPVHKVA
ncbi:hypothetical protein N7466_005349 [Penicillium verhagenii]|uniref:uncharacterized protein n=1 Tax=Penicillium verhagenii TaxID=1562060 RepID=UPI0025450084|nr:uncharacterized protein N7466_005349 [Penicillium verhagenii]KAJ5935802.1 hypothetical protein N7466_005349 [Penicillium verhagenii]